MAFYLHSRRVLRPHARFVFALAIVGAQACTPNSPSSDAGADATAPTDAAIDTFSLDVIEDTSLPRDTATQPPDDGPPPDASTLSRLNDEFDNAATMSGWTDLFPNRHTVLDIHTSRAGFLTIVPNAEANNGWYSENEGPLYYKLVTGDFVVETHVTVGTATDRTQLPTLPDSYVQGGFVLRDPASTRFRQRWIMYNLGFQDNAPAREIKTTLPSTTGTTDSLSTLNLNNIVGGSNQGALRVCRLGSVFRFYYRHPGSSTWAEETFRTTGPTPTRVFGNGPRPSRTDNSPLSFDRPDLPATIQVGLYTGNYLPPPQGTRGEFDYARFAPATTVADCTRDF